MSQTQHTSQPTLESVLDDFVEAGPDKETLLRFIDRFPEYRSDLIDFAAHWGVQEHLPEEEGATGLDELNRRGHEIAMRRLRDLDGPTELHQSGMAEPSNSGDDEEGATTRSTEKDTLGKERQVTGHDVPPSFKALLKEKGLDLARFGDVSGLGFSTLANLSTSRLTFASSEERRRVAGALAGCIEEATQGEIEANTRLEVTIERSLTRPPRQTAGAHRAEKAPETATQDFFAAIREDREMSEEAKRRWLRFREE